MWVVDTHKLAGIVRPERRLAPVLRFFGMPPDPPTQWDLYKATQKLVSVDYDDKSGNLNISYMDPDPANRASVC